MNEKTKKMYVNRIVNLFDDGRQLSSGMDTLLWLAKIEDLVCEIYDEGKE